MYENTDISHYT